MLKDLLRVPGKGTFTLQEEMQSSGVNICLQYRRSSKITIEFKTIEQNSHGKPRQSAGKPIFEQASKGAMPSTCMKISWYGDDL